MNKYNPIISFKYPLQKLLDKLNTLMESDAIHNVGNKYNIILWCQLYCQSEQRILGK